MKPVPKEKWRCIVGFEDYYQVSSFGAVRSLDRVVKFIHRNKETTATFRGRPIKFYYDRCNYARVTLVVNSNSFKFMVHRLVASSFLMNPNNYPEVNHIDGNKRNNHVSNLEWCSREHNKKHAYSLGLYTSKRSLCFNDQIKAIALYKSGMSSYRVAKIFNCNSLSIRTYAIKGPKPNRNEQSNSKLSERKR
jgi:hypothetical protein